MRPDILSSDVLAHFGMERPEGYYSDRVRYSLAEDDARPTYDEGEASLEARRARDGELNAAAELLERLLEARPAVTLTETEIEGMARDIRAEYDSAISAQAVREGLRGIEARMRRGGGVNGLLAEADALARSVLEKARAHRTQEYHEYADFRATLRSGFCLTEAQKAEAGYLYGSYGAFRRTMMGKITIKNSGPSLDALWSELCDQYPSLARDAAEGDMIAQVAEAAERLYTFERGGGQADARDAALDMALRVVERIDARRAQAATKGRADALESDMAGMRAQYQEKIARLMETRRKEELRAAIRRTAGALLRWAERPTKTNHMPEELRAPARAFVAGMEDGSWREKLTALAEATDALAGEAGAGSGIRETAAALLAAHKGGTLGDLDESGLRALRDVLTRTKHLAQTMNSALANEKYRTIEELHRESVREMRERSPKRERMKKLPPALRKIVEYGDNFLNVDMLDPGSFFDRLGKAARTVFDGIYKRGMDTLVRRFYAPERNIMIRSSTFVVGMIVVKK